MRLSQQFINIKNTKDVFMRKDRITVALTKDLIKTLDEESRKARRSRSDYIQLILEKHLNQLHSSKVENDS
jgi:metal-responsive CopG/Arc/MetJ family transcriptional regulator